jgi:eukaryotic-like serine/threonine-protein kinase
VLAAGTCLGPYEVLAPLGAGGMGEVYRARDTRLGREVAVKVLPADVSTTDEWRKRFEREAKAISKLAHPHVCALFDVGRHGDTDYLVMELLSGETLAARLAKGPLPFPDVLSRGGEMASALSATHAVGIAHGDLKPSNVMLTKSGVKLLDFGVSRPLPRPAARDATGDSTLSSPRPADGNVVGTFAYMAPEQLDGKAADASTDLFALGAVLYEMATGERAFAGPSAADVMSAVLTRELPSVSARQPASPPAFDRLVRTCVAKSAEGRWNSAHDVGLVLNQLRDGEGSVPVPGPARRRWAWLPWGMVVLVAGTAIAAFLLRPARETFSTGGGSVRFLVPPPPNNSFSWNVEEDSVAMSPDGAQLAFVAVTSKGERRVWVRRMSDLEARPLPATEGASGVFWSPDARSIGFFAQGLLKRLDLEGGASITLLKLDSDLGLSGSWGKGGEILVAVDGRILRVPASGGTASVAVQPGTSPGDVVCYPWFLPDGKRFLYLAGRRDALVVMMASPGEVPTALTAVGSKIQYTEPGVLLFVRDGALLAQHFDWRQGRLSGAPFAVAQHVRSFESTGTAEFSTSLNGTLALQTAEDAQRLVLVDRNGRELGTLAASGNYHDFTISPSGTKVAFTRATPGLGTRDVWSVDVERGIETRITSAPTNEEYAFWLPNEKAIVFSNSEKQHWPTLFLRNVENGTDSQLVPAAGFQIAQDVSPDETSLIYTEMFRRVWRLPLTGAATPSPVPVLRANFNLATVRFSPDGSYVAFVSDESGGWEAYIAPYPGPGGKLRISNSGALKLRWNRGTGAIFYSDGDGKLWTVPVRTQPSLHVGSRTALFASKGLLQRLYDPDTPTFDVFPDGKRILIEVPEVVADELPLSVVTNWPTSVPN